MPSRKRKLGRRRLPLLCIARVAVCTTAGCEGTRRDWASFFVNGPHGGGVGRPNEIKEWNAPVHCHHTLARVRKAILEKDTACLNQFDWRNA